MTLNHVNKVINVVPVMYINYGIDCNSSQINTNIINFNINVSGIACRYRHVPKYHAPVHQTTLVFLPLVYTQKCHHKSIYPNPYP